MRPRACLTGLHPTLGPAATPMGEVFQYLVESDSASLIELKNLQEYTIKPLLRTIPGVADISAWGGMVQQFQVEVDPHRLDGYGLTLDDVRARARREQRQLRRRLHRDPRRAPDGARSRARRRMKPTSSTWWSRRERGGTPILVRDVAARLDWRRCRAKAPCRETAAGEALSGKVIMLKGIERPRGRPAG